MVIAIPNSLRRRLNYLVGNFVRWVRLNAVTQDKDAVLKRRNPFGRRITPLANWFFRQCRVPISFWTELSAWQRWEVTCFRMLNPQYSAAPVGVDGVREDKLPGESLWVHLRRGTLKRNMLVAAGKELRRAHDHWSDVYQGRWSHGDAAMCNVLYDSHERRARLIDFELVHDRSLSPAARHADDLMAFLLDLASHVQARRWLPFSLAFLRAYGDPEVMEQVRSRLQVPRGTAWLWWKVRINFVPGGRVARRLAQLKKAIDEGALPHCALPGSGAAELPIQKRRPSSHCHTTIPGMPKASSRTRLVSESASEA